MIKILKSVMNFKNGDRLNRRCTFNWVIISENRVVDCQIQYQIFKDFVRILDLGGISEFKDLKLEIVR